MRVKTTVGQVALVGGHRHDQPSGVLVDERTSLLTRRRDPGSLYVLVEVTGPAAGRDIMAGQLAELVRNVYSDWRGSVTAGLQQALHAANSLLFEENQNSLPGERRKAGVSCVVLRDADLFVAQAGPAAVYLAQEGQVSRFPDISPWLDGVPPEEIEAVALGEHRDARIALFHSQVSAGNTILLAESRLASHVPSRKWPGLLSIASVEKMLDALLAAGEGKDLSALVVRLGEEGTKEAPAWGVAPDEGQEMLGSVSPALWERASLWSAHFRIGESVRTVGRTLVTALSSLWAALLVLLKRMVPGQPSEQPASGRQVTTVKSAGKRPKKRQTTRATDTAQSDLVQKVLIGVAIAIPLIVISVVVFTVFQRSQTHKAELEALWQKANDEWTQAGATTDPVAIRTRLAAANDSLDQLLKRQPDDAQAIELRKQIEARLDEINQVKRVGEQEDEIIELNVYPADAELSRVVVEGAHVFVLDRKGGRVYHHQLNDRQQALQPDSQETVLIRKGDRVGDVLVSDLVDMVWVPVGEGRQKASLVVLERGGALLEYDPATKELRSLQVAASDTWQFPTLVGSIYGRFYLLDPNANMIWRYYPTADGYSNLPDEWLKEAVDLAGVKDMVIGDSIYLLYADGKIRKLWDGRPDAFDISDWDTPPNDPAAIFTRPSEEMKWLYVADRGNSRIVQASQEGRFEQQFRLTGAAVAEHGDLLAQVTSFFVDEIGGHAYLLSERKLYLLVLPISRSATP
jgi:hypothetical protein